MLHIEEHANLEPFNTFGVKATARARVECDDERELAAFIAGHALPPGETLVLGGGSNVLFTGDYPGVIIHPAMKGIEVIDQDETTTLVHAGAGERWDDVARATVERGLWGLENLSGIPGNAGATPVQNIGAYGVEVGERVARVEAIERGSGERVVVQGAACRFDYRDSIFKREWRDRLVITRVTYRLSRVPLPRLEYAGTRQAVERLGEPSPARVREAILQLRAGKLPDVERLPNAGSFFKNPEVERRVADRLAAAFPGMPAYPAGDGRVKLSGGWLIEQSGWKGRALGNAAVDERQALVLVNRGGATGEAIARLANEVKKAVFTRFGVWLEPEVCII